MWRRALFTPMLSAACRSEEMVILNSGIMEEDFARGADGRVQ
jgi:hypothetical protein